MNQDSCKQVATELGAAPGLQKSSMIRDKKMDLVWARTAAHSSTRTRLRAGQIVYAHFESVRNTLLHVYDVKAEVKVDHQLVELREKHQHLAGSDGENVVRIHVCVVELHDMIRLRFISSTGHDYAAPMV